MIGQVIGNFRIIEVLGRGGMGEVMLAEHVGIQTRVAVKVLLPEISRNVDHVHRLFNEARIVSRIKHAGIAKIFDVGFVSDQAYLVMELLEGESLAARIRRVGALPMDQVADIGRQIASVLAATHAAGITHRDLKPDNIYLVADDELERRERVKVLDFGIAKLSGGQGPRTIGTMGTPDYMAPEQWGNSATVDWRADAYSLGCVLFEMVVGRTPFSSSTIVEAFTNHTQAAPPSPRSLGAQIPYELDQLIVQLLAKRPEDRPSMATVVDALEAMDSSTVSTTSSMKPAQSDAWGRAVTTMGGSAGQMSTLPPRRSTRMLGIGVGAGAIAIMAIVAMIASKRASRDDDAEPSRARVSASAADRATTTASSSPPTTTTAPTTTSPTTGPSSTTGSTKTTSSTTTSPTTASSSSTTAPPATASSSSTTAPPSTTASSSSITATTTSPSTSRTTTTPTASRTNTSPTPPPSTARPREAHPPAPTRPRTNPPRTNPPRHQAPTPTPTTTPTTPRTTNALEGRT